MPKDPDISVRRWIKWHNGEAEEPTSTLVLTSPTSKYVDIRVFLPSVPGSSSTRSPPASTAAALGNCSIHIPGTSVSQLNWAFCGTSSRTSATADRPVHGVWARWVDSWEPNSKAHLLKDEGDLFPYHEGDEELELEKGKMVQPQTQQVTDYEELWASGSALWAQDVEDESRTCVMLSTVNKLVGDSTDAEDNEARGMVIRVGQWIQGIVKQGDNLLVERWLWNAPGDIENANDPTADTIGDWTRIVRIQQHANGDTGLCLPCPRTMSPEGKIVEGDVFRSGESPSVAWKVEELVKW